jgi:hypothetical protein
MNVGREERMHDEFCREGTRVRFYTYNDIFDSLGPHSHNRGRGRDGP